ncbi:MAG: ABC transporter substrate-binding protein [Alphaproteobacteria bacterium]|nr:MAG: ABC transporter substrate-binding protein [Alphaproteobacteria bacterium]
MVFNKKYIIILFLFFNINVSIASDENYQHAISVFNEIKYKNNFKYFDYVNPNAPKKGVIKLAERGTFDSLNQFILKGLPAIGLDNIYDSLLVTSLDEPLTAYGLIAKGMKVSEDNTSITFFLNQNAVWHDNNPVTSYDIEWTFNTILEKGHPSYKSYYSDIKSIEIIDKYTIKFHFKNDNNRELPIIIGQMKILPKHFWKDKKFDASVLSIPLGSGPYKIKEVNLGKNITYERVKYHWAQELPVNIGHNNFNEIHYDYYRDSNVMIEALKANEYDFRSENISKEWATAYNDLKNNTAFIKEEIDHELPQGMQAFIYNMRKDIFKNLELRKALALAFDFEWTNKTLFYGQYIRSSSYFSNSDLASSGLPSKEEMTTIKKLKNKVPKEILTEIYNPGKTDGSGNSRKNLRKAIQILKEANYKLENKILKDSDGRQIKFEILLISPAFERIVGPFIKNLRKLGVEANIRIVDTAQYKNRLDSYDFDMVVMARGQSLNPGNEQRNFWSSKSANINGSANWIGIKNKTIDELIELIIQAPNRKKLIIYTKLLDRVLLHNHYVIPHWHIKMWRVAYWDNIKRPDNLPKYSLGFPETWWYNK